MQIAVIFHSTSHIFPPVVIAGPEVRIDLLLALEIEEKMRGEKKRAELRGRRIEVLIGSESEPHANPTDRASYQRITMYESHRRHGIEDRRELKPETVSGHVSPSATMAERRRRGRGEEGRSAVHVRLSESRPQRKQNGPADMDAFRGRNVTSQRYLLPAVQSFRCAFRPEPADYSESCGAAPGTGVPVYT